MNVFGLHNSKLPDKPEKVKILRISKLNDLYNVHGKICLLHRSLGLEMDGSAPLKISKTSFQSCNLPTLKAIFSILVQFDLKKKYINIINSSYQADLSFKTD